MDYCLSVTEFTATLVFHFAICFYTPAERHTWMSQRLTEHHEQWLAVFCTRQQLREQYTKILFGTL